MEIFSRQKKRIVKKKDLALSLPLWRLWAENASGHSCSGVVAVNVDSGCPSHCFLVMAVHVCSGWSWTVDSEASLKCWQIQQGHMIRTLKWLREKFVYMMTYKSKLHVYPSQLVLSRHIPQPLQVNAPKQRFTAICLFVFYFILFLN